MTRHSGQRNETSQSLRRVEVCPPLAGRWPAALSAAQNVAVPCGHALRVAWRSFARDEGGTRRLRRATVLSVSVDPTLRRMRVDLLLHDAGVDPAVFASTTAHLIRPLLMRRTGSVRVDVYQTASSRPLDSMTLVATASDVSRDDAPAAAVVLPDRVAVA